jgi:hypothetical protein
MARQNLNVRLLAALAILIPIAGCKSNKPKPLTLAVPNKPVQEVDPLAQSGGCDDRMQDIGGLFLMYWQKNHHLPDKLDELKSLPGGNDVGDFTCPVSNLPYIYNRDGIPTPSGSGRIILYDAAPSHHGMRLGLVVVDLGPGRALVATPKAFTESFFHGK